MADFNLADWLVDRHVREGRGDSIAVRYMGRSVAYQVLRDLAARVGGALIGLDVRPGDRVLVAMFDSVEMAAFFLGATRIGAVPVLVNPMLPARDLAPVAVEAGARVAVVSGEKAGAVGELIDGSPDMTSTIVTGDRDLPHAVGAEVYGFDAILAGANPVAPRMGSGEEPGFWLCTGGTTGPPKLVMHRQIDGRLTYDTYATQVLGIERADRCYSVAPMFHAYGLGNSLMFPLGAGATTVLVSTRPPTPDVVSATLAGEQPTLFFSVPTSYAALAESLARDAFASVRQGVSAGEALPAEIFERYRDHFGLEILDGIGSTEMGHIYISNRPGEAIGGSSGFVVPGHEIRLLDDEEHEVPVETPGNLWVRGPAAATGYWCRTDATRRTFVGEWVRTGDVYQRSEDDRYTYLGRSDELFKVAGEWVSPFEVESALAGLEGVVEVAVVPGLFDGLLRPVAFVVLAPGSGDDEESLQAQCKPLLAGFKRPRRIRVVDALPKTAVGKIQRVMLRDQLREEMTGA
jgi:benzoate-CoA ligase family protein